MITDLKDITSFKWATVVTAIPLSIKLDGDTAALALEPDSLVDPATLVPGDRVRVELSLRKAVVHGKSAGMPQPWQEWAAKGGPTAYVSDCVVSWAKAIDSGHSLDASFSANGIKINETGVYMVDGRIRGEIDGTYASLSINGLRTTIENRAAGMFDHDHAGVATAAPGFTLSRYIGPLNAGELVGMGPPSARSTQMSYGSDTFRGTLIIRRIS